MNTVWLELASGQGSHKGFPSVVEVGTGKVECYCALKAAFRTTHGRAIIC